MAPHLALPADADLLERRESDDQRQQGVLLIVQGDLGVPHESILAHGCHLCLATHHGFTYPRVGSDLYWTDCMAEGVAEEDRVCLDPSHAIGVCGQLGSTGSHHRRRDRNHCLEHYDDHVDLDRGVGRALLVLTRWEDRVLGLHLSSHGCLDFSGVSHNDRLCPHLQVLRPGRIIPRYRMDHLLCLLTLCGPTRHDLCKSPQPKPHWL